MTANQTGALLMIGSMAAFTFNDVLVKLVGGALPLPQILTIRGLAASLLIYLLARRLGSLRMDLPRPVWGLIGLRCLCEVGATYLFLTALMRMPIANITAVLQILPLSVTLAAALFLKEPVGWRRFAAIAIGFCGMLLIVRPGPEGFSEGALYALGAVCFVTCRDLVTRRMPPQVPSMTVTLCASLSVLAFGAVSSVAADWQPGQRQPAAGAAGGGAVHFRRLSVFGDDHARGRDRGDCTAALQRAAVGLAAGLGGVR